MEALQYIYTSWKNGDSTEKGYMIYSRSQGISETECSAIKDAMQYLAPKELPLTPSPQEIADVFPYAFSYFILPTGRGCVAQSTYLGKDYSGRFGNYIIYALVFDINDLPCLPAELFGEAYIKTSMTDEELNAPSPVPPLPPLHISDYASVINDEQLNEFLFDKEEEFAHLLSMLLQARDSGVPFYLNDTRENLVLWAAAVQRVLPRRVAKKFMFNTYIGDHEAMRSARAKEAGLNFHLIGVRPDANYFNYGTECKSNRHMVMDFIGGHMTPGVVPSQYAQAMASSITLDYEDIDAFSDFVDKTSLDEIGAGLQNAYLCYQLLRNDEFEFSEENLKVILDFAATHCSESDNADIGSRLLAKHQEDGWILEPDTLVLFWNFVCKYSGFMIFTLYDLVTDSIYQQVGEATQRPVKIEEFLKTLKNSTPQQYKEYLDYVDTPASVDHMLLYLSGHGNPVTNAFYITWLLRDYSFVGGVQTGQPVAKLLATALKNLATIKDCEKEKVEIMLATANNRILFESITNFFMNSLQDQHQWERLCAQYVAVSENMSDGEIGRFERLLLETPGTVPLATRLCARKIAASKKPEAEFWRFYENNRGRVASSTGFALDPMILSCINHCDAKIREDLCLEILERVDHSLITDGEVIRRLTDTVNGCSVKTLAKMDTTFLRQVGELRARVDKTGFAKVKAVFLGELLAMNNVRQSRPLSLSGQLARTEMSLQNLDKADYETYLKRYFEEYVVLIQENEDIPALIKIFYHGRCFSSFVDDYVSALKKMEKKQPERWKRIAGWTCVYLVNAERGDPAAEGLYTPYVRYLRSISEEALLDVRQNVIRDIPSSRCEYLFDDAQRKEGFSEKLGNLFRKKQ